MDIRPLDPSDDIAMRAWHATYHAAHVFGREFSTPWMLEEVRADLLADRPGTRTLAFVGDDDGEIVCTGSVELPMMDNTHLAFLDVHTHPDHRNRVHGSQMLEHLVGVAREQGRRTVAAEATTPYDGPADGSGHPNADFLLDHGFANALGNVMRVLDLPADEARLRRLADEAAPHHAAYTLRQFVGPVPDDILEPFGALIGALVTEAPTGELEREPEVFDATRIRTDEEVFAASGRTKYTTVAVAEDGTVAAYSEVAVPAHDPGRVYQWGTLVLRGHRGHRLGLATKVHNLLWLQRERPDLRLLVTYNAEVNGHMIVVNEAMGFRPVERLGEFERQLPPVG